MTGAFQGKVVVVTGAGRGIGRAIALAYAAEGARVALAGRSADQLDAVAAEVEDVGGRALPVVTDLCEESDVAGLSERVADGFGDVDVLVNNSGIAGPTSVLWETEPEDWERTLRVNLTGTYLCCRAFLPGMVARRRGNIVVIGSVTGKRPLYGRTPYAASKLGLVGLVRTLAWETGEFGIRVNLISPGAVEGKRLDAVIDAQARAMGLTFDEARTHLASSSALGSFVTAKDVARAALFLSSDDSGSLTGEDLNLSAGLAMY